MTAPLWFVSLGLLLVVMALAGSVLKRVPLSSALIYLMLGYAAVRANVGDLDPLLSVGLLERLSELAVIVSLFCSGLKMRAPLSDPAWRLPIRLASAGMVVTVGLVTVLGVLLGLPLGAAILLGAVLAPTDPVLASDVQVAHPRDADRLRFGLTGEAGLNDGAAFPFVMLGLGVLGLHELGPSFTRWAALDVLWAIGGGTLIGWVLGSAVGRLVVYLRRTHREAVGLDDFLALGLIAGSYGLALLVASYGFMAVFAAGLALRRTEQREATNKPPADVQVAATPDDATPLATHPEKAPSYMAAAVLGFTEQMERIGEVVLMLVVGALLARVGTSVEGLIVAAALLFVVRPVAVALVAVRSGASWRQRALMGWFGIRGIGSLYYLFFALNHGLPKEHGDRFVPLVLTVVACSAVLHGTSVTPLMRWYNASVDASRPRAER